MYGLGIAPGVTGGDKAFAIEEFWYWSVLLRRLAMGRGPCCGI